MHVVERDQFVFSFSSNHAPVLTVQSGDRVVLRTNDCFSGQIRGDQDLVTSIDYGKINPATGPIFVEGALPGDVLRAEIIRISLDAQGVITTLPDIGTLIHHSEIRSKTVQIKEGRRVQFSEKIQFECTPMVGVIGVAPPGGEVACGHPGQHGGNLDSSCIAEGSSVYLPVFVPGALFGLGDLHASMGDGEMCGTGVEIAGEVEIRLTVLKGEQLAAPVVETKDSWYAVSSDHDVMAAIRKTSEDMQNMIVQRWELTPTDAYLLMGAVGDVQMSQCCKPCPVETVVRVRVPKLEGMPDLLK
ncbi:amidase [Paenibacillus sophorae]|uniref:Amidase n=1 Tax=Paenibacillus sophorae TaxID=1333845 RepID=A0A1H8RVT0_9BACL|nr:acetamidase/formamidase family protein [Paenibacillus sophorae]QWU16952.1 acetamidase/formamidase family protein [Paenibacillus sophorae]SEO70455.1 amidase [Paenibacillus sophorae]